MSSDYIKFSEVDRQLDAFSLGTLDARIKGVNSNPYDEETDFDCWDEYNIGFYTTKSQKDKIKAIKKSYWENHG